MVSVVRLLPRHKIVRNGVPYTKLLAWVLNTRFFNLMKFLTFVLTPLCLLQRFDVGLGLVGRLARLELALLVVLLVRKVRIATFKPSYPSTAIECAAKLLQPSYLALGAAYSLSALIYVWTLAAGSARLFETVKVELPPTPPGLPRNLDSRPHGTLRVVNQDFCFRYYFAVYAGFAYAAFHVLADFDVLPAKLQIDAPWRRLGQAAPATLATALAAAAAIVATWPAVYFIVSSPRVFKLFSVSVQGQTAFPGVVAILGASYHFLALVVAWHICNTAFTVYMSLGPYHRGHTISSPSQDPNGSLLSGFQHRSGSLTQLTAWQELLFIAEHDEQRRRAIFKDVDSDRVVWKLIYSEYTKLVGGTVEALDAKPKAAKPETPRPNAAPAIGASNCLFTRPAAANAVAPLKAETKNVFVRARISPSARLIEQMQDPQAARSQKAARWLGVVVPDIKKPLLAYLRQALRRFLLSPVGRPFRFSTSRQVHKLVPQGPLLGVALNAVAGLIVASHDEDPFGYVQVDIAATLSQLDRLLTLLDKVAGWARAEWLDAAVQEGLAEPDVSELAAVRADASAAFDAIAARFGAYFDDLKVSDAVKSRAK